MPSKDYEVRSLDLLVNSLKDNGQYNILIQLNYETMLDIEYTKEGKKTCKLIDINHDPTTPTEGYEPLIEREIREVYYSGNFKGTKGVVDVFTLDTDHIFAVYKHRVFLYPNKTDLYRDLKVRTV